MEISLLGIRRAAWVRQQTLDEIQAGRVINTLQGCGDKPAKISLMDEALLLCRCRSSEQVVLVLRWDFSAGLV